MGRKKTHEEFITELSQINPNIEILGTYVNNQTKIKCKCKLDGYEWEARPSHLLRGKGCPICGRKKISEQKRKTHNQFLQELQEINTDIEILGTYVNSKTKIKCKCRIDGHIWEPVAGSLLSGYGCPICGRESTIKSHTKTHDQFLQELQEVNPNIEVLGTYKNANTKIKCRCKIDGHEWKVVPSSLLRGCGCPKCKITKLAKTHDEFLQELYKINQDIEVLGTYVNTNTKIKVRCKIDEYEWETKPDILLRGHGCPICGEKQRIHKQTKTHEQFIKELQQVNPYIEILGTYINNHTKIKCRCRIDGYEWEVKPSSLLSGQGCPKCNTSKGEKRVAQYLDNLNILYIYDKQYFKDLVSVNGGLMRPDFIIPSLKIWIEYDGEQHFKPVDFSSKMSGKQVQAQFKKVQQNDQIKNEYAEQHGWTLIRIPYWDIDNIEKILENYIKEQEQAI